MKIKITYEHEEELSEALRTPLAQLVAKGGKLRKSDKHAPYYHAYITISNEAEAPDECRENT